MSAATEGPATAAGSATSPESPSSPVASPSPIPAVVLGATGYVGGELLRLLAAHPRFALAAAVSESAAGQPIAGVFPSLFAAFGDTRFTAPDALGSLLERPAERSVERPREPSPDRSHGRSSSQSPGQSPGQAPHGPAGDMQRLALFSAAPHGASAAMLARALSAAPPDTHAVDISADFRYASAADYEAVYGRPHDAPELIAQFTAGVPEQLPEIGTRHVGHPGCFATAVLLAAVPLLASGLVRPSLYVAGVTGSTGSGKQPVATTHHPERDGNLYAYKPLAHRHAPEITALAAAASGVRPRLSFVPHSGPFTRGIHVTLQAELAGPADAAAVRAAFAGYYRDSPFVRLVDGTPRIKDIVASNYAHLGLAVEDGVVAVMCVLDNLTKGAAGGAVQWMNRLFGLPETAGLTAPAPAWS